MLPEGWKSTTLGKMNLDISDGNYSSKYPCASDFMETGIPFLRANNIQSGTVNDDDMRYISVQKHNELQKGHLQKEDILITTRGDIGQISLVPERHIDSNINAQIVRINSNGLQNNLYLFHYFSFCKINGKFEPLTTGTALKQLPIGRLKLLSILLPPLPEQKKIAAILSTWDRAIEGTEKLLANSQQQKKALMQQLLTGKKRLPGFTGEWKKVSLEKTGKIVSGGTPDTTVPAYWDGDVLWLTPTDVTSLRGKYVDDTKRKITQTGIKDSATTLLPAGSLLVCTRATIGYMAIAKKAITTNQGFKNIVFNKLFLPEFVYYFLCTQRHEMQRLASGSTFAEISKKDFCKIHISAPTLPEQKAIAAVLTTADEEITALESDLSRLRQEKKALMQQLLTGKCRVTVD